MLSFRHLQSDPGKCNGSKLTGKVKIKVNSYVSNKPTMKLTWLAKKLFSNNSKLTQSIKLTYKPTLTLQLMKNVILEKQPTPSLLFLSISLDRCEHPTSRTWSTRMDRLASPRPQWPSHLTTTTKARAHLGLRLMMKSPSPDRLANRTVIRKVSVWCTGWHV